MMAAGWMEINCPVANARAFAHNNGLRVILGVEMHDGSPWRHVSTSRADRIPDYADMAQIKDQFFGPLRDAIEYWPRKLEHVNDHPYCRHLWGREDGERCAPDFRRFEISRLKLSI